MIVDKRGYLEVHFAVSDKVGVYTGKDAVSHIGLSVGDVGYNCGRNEGRDAESIISNGPYVAVKSPYRLDGFYLKLTDTAPIASTFQEFIDGYLTGVLDKDGSPATVPDTAARIPESRLEALWFTKVVKGLGALDTIKGLKNVGFVSYETEIRPRYSILTSVDFEEFEEFLHADTPEEELDVFQDAYPFMAKMTPAQYERLRQLNPQALSEFISLLVNLKRDLSNRMYDTCMLVAPDFNDGTYEMVEGYNCVRAAFFFLDNGLAYAAKKLGADATLAAEIKQIQALNKQLQEGNEHLRMPWRSFRRARWYSDDYKDSGFLDTPEDNIYWKDIRKIIKEARLTDKNKEKALRPSQRKELISKLTQKTDVTDYEQEGIEYVSPSKLTPEIQRRCAPFSDLLLGFGMGSGGGKRTRFV